MNIGKNKNKPKRKGEVKRSKTTGNLSISNGKVERKLQIEKEDRVDVRISKINNNNVVFTLLSENGKEEIQVEKWILANSSSVFKQMFDETKAASNRIQITDINRSNFKAFLGHAKGRRGKILNPSQAWDLMTLSDKFEYPDLFKESTDCILRKTTVDNALQIYKKAIDAENEKLILETIYFILKNADQVLIGNKMREMASSSLEFILSQDMMNIEDEIQLFDVVIYWAKTEIKDKGDLTISYIRSKIKPLLDKIRFLSLTEKQFREGPGQSPYLESEQKLQLLERITDETSRNPLPFDCCKREKREQFPENKYDAYIKEIILVNYCPEVRKHSIPLSAVRSVFKSKEKPFFITSVLLRDCNRSGTFILKIEDTVKLQASVNELGVIEFSSPIFIKRNKRFEFSFLGNERTSFYSCVNDINRENAPFYAVSTHENNDNELRMHCFFWSVLYFLP